MSLFLLNKSPATVILKDSRIVIPIGGHVSVPEEDRTHEDVLDAANRGWVELVEETPPEATPFKPEISFENSKPQGSLTIPGKEPVEAKVETPVAEEKTETATSAKKSKKAAEAETK